MSTTSIPVRLILVGALLLLAGLLLWQAAPATDLALHQALLLVRKSWWVRRARWLSVIGSFTVLGPLASAAVGLLLWSQRRHAALWLLLTIASGRLLDEGMKLIVQRNRPPVADRLQFVTSWSFPSSHSAGTMMTGMALALLWGRASGWLIALSAAAAVGWSRAALGVHWPSDVLAGCGFGLLWVGLSARWMPHPQPVRLEPD